MANISKRYPNGRTLKTKDEYLSKPKGEFANLKEERRVVIIDSNKHGELAVVALVTQDQPNSTHLPPYKQGNGRKTYFKHFVEIADCDGNPITADGERFSENPWAYDLRPFEVEYIRGIVLEHCKQAQSNQSKIDALKASDGKKSKRNGRTNPPTAMPPSSGGCCTPKGTTLLSSSEVKKSIAHKKVRSQAKNRENAKSTHRKGVKPAF